MNLLAHAYLSPPDPAILTGNVVADWVKGKARHSLPEPIRAGMLLHRRIDSFTDTHHLVAKSSALLSENWGRYSPVLTDIFFDHLLAANWSAYSNIPLRAFAAQTYAHVNSHRHCLPERCHYAIAAMTIDDWLTSYSTLDGIRIALSRMSNRLRHDIELAPAVEDFIAHREQFQSNFNEFFPQLRLHAETLPVEEGTLHP